MGFNEYISELLFEHNCVIVPGFGGLVANTSGARINTLTHEIFPPCKTIAFNQKLDHNDGLLANHLVRKLGISYDEAVVSIGQYSNQIRRELKSNNSFTISAVGNFHLNKENSIQFTPAEEINFLYGSFGFGAITLPGLPANQPVIAQGGKSISGRNRKLQWMAGTAAAILIIAACVFSFRSELFNLNHNTVTLNPFDTILGISDSEQTSSQTEPAKPAEIVITVPEGTVTVTETETVKVTETEKLSANTVETTAPKIISITPKNTHVETDAGRNLPESIEAATGQTRKFYIIGGAFSSKFNANRYRNMLEKKGFTATLAGKNRSGLTRVSYESYTDSLEAVSRLEFIKSNENQQAWLLAQ